MTRKVLNGLDLDNQRIVSLADPSSASDAATKAYVDQVARGLNWKQSVRAATTTNATLASGFEDGDVVVIYGTPEALEHAEAVLLAG